MERIYLLSRRALSRSWPRVAVILWFTILATATRLVAQESRDATPPRPYLCISGVYPHLAAFNQERNERGEWTTPGEAGIGAVVPWANQLWYLTYPPHEVHGSSDKLMSIDRNLHQTIHPESVGGTCANRMIHLPSGQLLIGYYLIDKQGHVRVVDPLRMPGRITACAASLDDPENKVLYYDMEGALYQVDIHTLDVTKLFEKPFPGWHGKGAYTGQNRTVFANNGAPVGQPESPFLKVGKGPKGPDDAGVLGQWDGHDQFEIVRERAFTDVTGPGGLSGNTSSEQPVWSVGWDKYSVVLALLDQGQWQFFRLPKASFTFDPRHGWFTEWPRIRPIAPDEAMMCMHATLFRFPLSFCACNTAGITPIASHLRYIPDFCVWNGKLVLATDESSAMQNPWCGQSQSNLWFGTMNDLNSFGPRLGWGSLWINDPVTAGTPSDPYLFAGYDQRVLHLKAQPGDRFSLQYDREGNNQWSSGETLVVPDTGYTSKIFSPDEKACWIRIVPEQASVASASFHYYTPRPDSHEEIHEFDSLPDATDTKEGLSETESEFIRPGHLTRALQWLRRDEKGQEVYREVEISDQADRLEFLDGTPAGLAEIQSLAKTVSVDFAVDSAAVLVTDSQGKRYRLPLHHPAQNSTHLRGIREVESERFLAHLGGTFYEIPRTGTEAIPNFEQIKPIATHSKIIRDFCSWRGLLVLAGTRPHAPADGHFFPDREKQGLWLGQIDDLWKLGKPVGTVGPWNQTNVESGVPGDPCLMTGYDQKTMTFSHNASENVHFRVEIDFDHSGFVPYQTVTVPPGEQVTLEFPAGFHAHWFRVVPDKSCQATVMARYQ